MREGRGAIDALPADAAGAGATLAKAIRNHTAPPLEAFRGLRLDDDYDNVRGGNENPLGLEWSDVLYFELWNRAQFEANR